MPRTWWGKALMAVYVAGYWLYVAIAAAYAWPNLSFWSWWTYVLFQAVYAVFWPILALLSLIGARW